MLTKRDTLSLTAVRWCLEKVMVEKRLSKASQMQIRKQLCMPRRQRSDAADPSLSLAKRALTIVSSAGHGHANNLQVRGLDAHVSRMNACISGIITNK